MQLSVAVSPPRAVGEPDRLHPPREHIVHHKEPPCQGAVLQMNHPPRLNVAATSSTSSSHDCQVGLAAKLEALREISSCSQPSDPDRQRADVLRAPELLARASAVAKAGLEQSRALVESLSPTSRGHLQGAASPSAPESVLMLPAVCHTAPPQATEAERIAALKLAVAQLGRNVGGQQQPDFSFVEDK